MVSFPYNQSFDSLIDPMNYFNRAENTNFPHTLATVEVSQYFANYFVNEARKSDHVFKSKQEIIDNLIQNHQPIFTARDGSNYFETYLFTRDQEF